jgi:hypothetical protein
MYQPWIRDAHRQLLFVDRLLRPLKTIFNQRQHRISQPPGSRFLPSLPGQTKLGNHEHAVALHYMFYNFARIHQSLRVTFGAWKKLSICYEELSAKTCASDIGIHLYGRRVWPLDIWRFAQTRQCRICDRSSRRDGRVGGPLDFKLSHYRAPANATTFFASAAGAIFQYRTASSGRTTSRYVL